MRRLPLVSIALVALFVGLAPAAWASAPSQASATGVVPFQNHTQTLIRMADGNATFSAVDIVALTGGITGTAIDTYVFTVHPDGSTTGHGTETCSACTIGGRTGGYTEVFSFTATPNFATFDGRFAVTSATGGLAGLRGEGTFHGGATAAGFSETVVLNYHFDPQ